MNVAVLVYRWFVAAYEEWSVIGQALWSVLWVGVVGGLFAALFVSASVGVQVALILGGVVGVVVVCGAWMAAARFGMSVVEDR